MNCTCGACADCLVRVAIEEHEEATANACKVVRRTRDFAERVSAEWTEASRSSAVRTRKLPAISGIFPIALAK